MYRLFLQVFDLSLVAGLIILLLLPLRLLLKRAPRVISYALWAVVLFRESLGVKQLIGIAFVVLGTVIVNSDKKKEDA